MKIRANDLIEVKTPDEILQTLDAEGTLDCLPFMPEMIESCGKRFRVARRALKTCVSGSGPSTMRGFKNDGVVILDGLRCSGAAHDGCQKECMIFWHEEWLRRVEESDLQHNVDSESAQRLRSRLKTKTGPKTYFCQASEILNITVPLSRPDRFAKCVSEVRSGNCSAVEMIRRIGIWLFWRIRRKIVGEYARGENKSTPSASLNLRRGETIQVRSIEDIVATTNERAQNRGLYFAPDMRLLCGETAQVRSRLEKIIVDGTGEMRQLHNTVYLEESMCGCAHVAFGGCPRGEFAYWREIWLRRRVDS
jgi:hypothetical protein